MNPYRDLEESSFTAAPHLAYEDIATKLLKDNFFLTALELHTELVESGKELPQLREFFSNPGNFEQHVSRASEFVSMHRSPSQATLDSLDTARYSEDGGGDRGGSGGDVAVLEFELHGESALDKNAKGQFNQRSLKPHERRALNFLINEYLLLQDYKLTSITFSDENPDQLYDAAIVSLNSLTSPGSESKVLELQLPEEKLSQARVDPVETRPLTCTATENHYGSENSTHSVTPEQFEMIDSEKNSVIMRKEGSNTSSYDPAIVGDNSTRGSPTRHGSVTTLDETLSINDAGEWTRVHYEYNSIENCNKEMWIDSGLPNTLKLSIINWCSETLSLNEPLNNDLLAELVNNDKPVTLPGLLTLVADTLPKILPHTLVARRCEAAALLAASAALLPHGDARRARTLQALLALCYFTDAVDAKSLLIAMNSLLLEKPDIRWPELIWFIDLVKQILGMATSSKVLNYPTIYELVISLFSSYIDNFGVQFALKILMPIFLDTILDLEQKMEKLHSVNVDNTVVVGVYLVTVLPALGDATQHEEFLQNVTRACLIRGSPIEAQCWPPVEDLLADGRSLTVREVARAAEALALLVLPTAENAGVSERAVSLLCALCGRGGAAPEKLEEIVQAPAFAQYRPAVEVLLHNSGGAAAEPAREPPRASNLLAAQAVGRRVSLMLQNKANI
ncbi:hypothetical protein MSG28_005099 [Choristoneura fumiferana]|uniref:Uncharacterized protein n=1 Tax=Choristoneura fumiferana TaxID=7141 RepID=A0ACC0JPU4_CHOFU|nr:hypothetical protein MSG28_005099 [Choristoneura fumiferana]